MKNELVFVPMPPWPALRVSKPAMASAGALPPKMPPLERWPSSEKLPP